LQIDSIVRGHQKIRIGIHAGIRTGTLGGTGVGTLGTVGSGIAGGIVIAGKGKLNDQRYNY